MQKLNAILDRLPDWPVYLIGTVLFFAPGWPEPHLWQKLNWILDGVPFKPIDIFDVFLHGGAGVIAALKFYRERTISPEEKDARDAE